MFRPTLQKYDLCKLSKKASPGVRAAIGNRTVMVRSALASSDGKCNVKVSYMYSDLFNAIPTRRYMTVKRRELWKCPDRLTNEFKKLKTKEMKNRECNNYNIVAAVRAIPV